MLRNVYRALEPGGVFIFDVRLPATKPVKIRVVARTGNDWACIATIDEHPAKKRIVRQITTFRRVGKTYCRSEEQHTLQLYDKSVIRGWLKQLGFRARGHDRCGEYRLGRRQRVFVARKGR